MLSETNLDLIRLQYQIPREYELKVPSLSDRVCNPPLARIALYGVFPNQAEAPPSQLFCSTL